MKNIYCLSGLGADERIFAKLKIEGVNLVHLPWAVFDLHDELPCYAQKMSALIKEENPIIMGISFGGMLATEISKLRPVQQLFLISTAKGKHEFPPMNSLLQYFIKHQLIPFSLFTRPNRIVYNKFGAVSQDDKKVLGAIIKDTDPEFLKWASKAVLEWRNETEPSHFVHIHGTKDKIIQPDPISATYWIEGGGHMMIYNHADEISLILQKELEA